MLRNPNENKMVVMKIAANILLYWGIAVTSLTLIGIFAGDDNLNENTGSLIVGIIFIGIIPIILGIYLKKIVKKKYVKYNEKHRQTNYNEIEKKIILAARRKGGLLNLSQASLATGENLKDTKIIMDKLASNGFCEIDVDDNGVILYLFLDFLKDEKL